MASCCQRTPITLLLRAGLPERGLSCERACGPNGPAIAHPSRRDQVAPRSLPAKPGCAPVPSKLRDAIADHANPREVARSPHAPSPAAPWAQVVSKWCPSGVQRAPKSHGGGNGRSAARRLCRQVGGLQGRSGKGYARSRDCDVGWLEPVERPAGQPFPRASQRACLVQCGNEVPTAALTASPPVPNLGPKHANAALLQLRKCEGKSGRSGRRDGGRGSIEISGHWPSCRPGLLWHWSSYRR